MTLGFRDRVSGLGFRIHGLGPLAGLGLFIGLSLSNCI